MAHRNPFWACLLVFAILGADAGQRLMNSFSQRKQLDAEAEAQTMEISRNSERLQKMPELEARLQNLSLDVMEVAKTNANAAQIVRDFNIKWTPGPGQPPAPMPDTPPSPVSSTPAQTAPPTNAPSAP